MTTNANIRRIERLYPTRLADEVEALISRDSRDVELIRQARRVVSGIASSQFGKRYKIPATVSMIKAILEWVRTHVTYVKDPIGMELIETPSRIIKHIQENGQYAGDCDDITGLTGAMLRAIGIPSRACLVAFDRARGYQHIYAEAWVGVEEIGWVGVDPCLSDEDAPLMAQRVIRSYFGGLNGAAP